MSDLIDDLGDLIVASIETSGGLDIDRLAERILAAGWRPPVRTVTAAEELDALPVGSIIRGGYGDAWHKDDDGWSCTDTTFAYLSKTIVNLYGPVTVVYTPEES